MILKSSGDSEITYAIHFKLRFLRHYCMEKWFTKEFLCTGKMKYVSFGICGLFVIILIVGLSLALIIDDYNGSDALNNVPLIDGHNDLPYNLYRLLGNNLDQFDFTKNLSDDKLWGKHVCVSCTTDLPRLKKGKVGAQFWAAYVDCSSQYKDAVSLTLRQIDVIKRLIRKYPNDLQFVTKAEDITDAWNNKKIASMIGVEGGHSIDSSLAVLRLYYDLGVRYMTLTHMCNTPWADASTVTTGGINNLTDFGRAVVYEMNRLGMLVDLSHVSHNVMREVLAISKAPIIFSHSSVFTLCRNNRNVPDDVLHTVKRNNGIVMVNFYSEFVNCNTSRKATMRDVIDHINYIRNLIGPNHIGIGADYDGVNTMPEGLEDVSKYSELFDRIYDSGPNWTKDEMEKLAGKNLIRVLKAAEKVRDEMAESGHVRQDILAPKEIYQAQIVDHLQSNICYTSKEWSDFKPNNLNQTV
ncbi:Dipeptidase [Apis cerana cerana]|uniref:Dipeptidase n=1 Tax=Apis cerana cerana TaxID=94128 RepID=A0A2A3EG90_APICC|nr:Dipeptidase [Apis cerana cerana]